MHDDRYLLALGKYTALKKELDKRLLDYQRRVLAMHSWLGNFRVRQGVVHLAGCWPGALADLEREGAELAELARAINLQAEICEQPKLQVQALEPPPAASV